MQVTNHSGSATNVIDIYIDPEGTTEKAFLAKQFQWHHQQPLCLMTRCNGRIR